MESYGLELDELFDDRDISEGLDDSEVQQTEAGGDDDDMNENSSASHHHHHGDENFDHNTSLNDGEGDVSHQVAEKLKALGKGAAKRRVLRPQPKLDATRLTGERGIPTLLNLFKDVKLKGRQHEVSDLSKMMTVMEHWAHRLFPKMPFDELIERVERLGQKKAVQTCVSKIRLDMPLLNEDFVRQVSDEEADTEHRGIDTDHMMDSNLQTDDQQMDTLDEEEVLDEILEQEANHSTQSQQIIAGSTPYHTLNAAHSQVERNGLTSEQLERIKQNQERALMRRLNKAHNNSANRTDGLYKTDDTTDDTAL